MKEKEKYIRDREEYERNLILEINSKKTRSTENFGDFLKRNIDEEKRNEAENNRRIEQENILQLQRSFLDEAVKLLSGASDRRDPTLSCDSTFSDEFRQQKRCPKKKRFHYFFWNFYSKLCLTISYFSVLFQVIGKADRYTGITGRESDFDKQLCFNASDNAWSGNERGRIREAEE